jgi:hypothetical protein
LQYGPNFKADLEVMKGQMSLLERMVSDPEEQTTIDLQLEHFKLQQNMFAKPMAIRARGKKTPGAWWESYGEEYPELQKFSIRILTLTCSSSKCECN